MRTIKISFSLSLTYSINSFIFGLKSLPLIKRLIPAGVYGSSGLKKVVHVIVMIYRFLKTFIGKFVYLGLMVYLPVYFLGGDMARDFRTILFLLSIAGFFTNTELFNPVKEKYYALILMRMNATQYARANYLWFLLKLMVSFIPALIVIGGLAGLPVWESLLFIPFILFGKMAGAFVYLEYYKITGKIAHENNTKMILPVILIALVGAYGLPFLHISINLWIFVATLIIIVIAGAFMMMKLWQFNGYGLLYKKMLNLNIILFNTAETRMQIQQKSFEAKLDSKTVIATNKKGYAYFNEIFTRRHHKILSKSAKRMAVIALVLVVALTAAVEMNDGIRQGVNNSMLKALPYFVFVMYLVNRGAMITQAMFMNCDHSMLTYRFYRQPKDILGLFRVRLITLIKVNMIPGAVIACALPYLLYISGGTSNPLDYLLLLISILAMVVFFSVHHLTLYYLLQPYNVNMESKSSIYSVASSVTYMVCYMFIRLQAPTTVFASLVIIFAVAYIAIALWLVYRLAPKRFKLK